MPLSLPETIASAVRQQYELFPYPNYGLLLPMKWQDAYASTAVFAAQLLREKHGVPAIDSQEQPRILMAGCGEIFPAVLARWEPKPHTLHAIDLSKRSLERARIRTWLAWRSCEFVQGDLNHSSLLTPESLAHIDAYGVLHHMANPLSAVPQLSAALQPGGTLRLMVYNSEARSWIHHLQRAFALLGLSGLSREDVRQGQALLTLLRRHLPALAERLEPMQVSLSNSARWVDTFLHAREARLSLGDWLRALEGSGLQALGLLDRYAELDDLPNPLYRMPSIEDLELRALDRRFENNLEIYCYKVHGKTARAPSPRLAMPWSIVRRPAPQVWTSYAETQNLGWQTTWKIWSLFRQTIYRRPPSPMKADAFKHLSPSAIGRLARIGALWPSSMQSAKQAYAPLHSSMEVPALPQAQDPQLVPGLKLEIERILLQKGLPLRYGPSVMQRFAAAQNS